MKIYIIICLISLSVVALTNNDKTEGPSYILTPDGIFQKQKGKFIDFEFQQYKADGMVLFKGTCRWGINADPERKLAIVPVKLFRADKDNKKLIPLAVYWERWKVLSCN